jgi:hypothetical protein
MEKIKMELKDKQKMSYLIERYSPEKRREGRITLSVYKSTKKDIDKLKFDRESYNDFIGRVLDYYVKFYATDFLPNNSKTFTYLKNSKQNILRGDFTTLAVSPTMKSRLNSLCRTELSIHSFLDKLLVLMDRDKKHYDDLLNNE